jgi:hypothetical protein
MYQFEKQVFQQRTAATADDLDMANPAVTSFRARPFSIGADVGFPTGAGVRAGYSPMPELGIEVHVGTLLLLNVFGADLSYRPLAGAFNVSPFVRLGINAVQSSLFGGPAWQPMGAVQVGGEWRSNGGFSLSAGFGAALTSPGGRTSVIPGGTVSIGYAF